jgi:hypothetical protein
VEALRKNERHDETQFIPKLLEKLVWGVPVISFCKIFISSYAFDALLWSKLTVLAPPNHGTLWITLLFKNFLKCLVLVLGARVIFDWHVARYKSQH